MRPAPDRRRRREGDTTVELAPHAEPYTVDEVLELVPEEKSAELLEGTLIVSTHARGRHQTVGDAITDDPAR